MGSENVSVCILRHIINATRIGQACAMCEVCVCALYTHHCIPKQHRLSRSVDILGGNKQHKHRPCAIFEANVSYYLPTRMWMISHSQKAA